METGTSPSEVAQHRSCIQNLLDHLSSKGVDAAKIRLKAAVGLLHSGEQEHHSGSMLQVFTPVATRLDFVIEGNDCDTPSSPIITAVYEASAVKKDILIDSDVFNEHVVVRSDLELPGDVNRDAGLLMREIVDKHRDITGEMSAAYEHREIDQRAIEQIKRTKFSLEIELERLAKFVDIHGAINRCWLNNLRPGADHAKINELRAELEFEQSLLTDRFRKDPCSKTEYLDLRRHFADSRVTSMDFIDYYEWYKKSAVHFDAEGRLSVETGDGLTLSIKAFHSTGCRQEDFRDRAIDISERMLQTHPIHRESLEKFIDKVIEELPPRPGQAVIQAP